MFNLFTENLNYQAPIQNEYLRAIQEEFMKKKLKKAIMT